MPHCWKSHALAHIKIILLPFGSRRDCACKQLRQISHCVSAQSDQRLNIRSLKSNIVEVAIYYLSNFIIQANILKPTAIWSPYIFTLVQKVKHRLYKIHVFK